MDLVTDLSISKTQKDAVLVVVDRASKMAKFIACKKTMSSTDMVKIFRDNIVCSFRIPKTITSNNDIRVTAQFWQELWKALGTSIMTVTPYHQ